jgi:hypothetical protein
MMQQAHLPTAQKQAIPDHVSQLAAAHQVGAVVSEYTSNAGARMLSGLLLSVLGGGGTLLLGYVFATRNAGVIVLLLLALLLLGYGISSCRRAWRNRGVRVYLCAEGVMRLERSRVEAMRWDQVMALYKVFGGGTYNIFYLKRYVLLRIGGAALPIDKAFHNFDELGRKVEEEVTRRLLPGALAAYEGGATLPFGLISVNAQGLSVRQGQKTLRWDELQELYPYAGTLIGRKKGSMMAWCRLPISGIPNACVLLALLKRIAPDKVRDV